MATRRRRAPAIPPPKKAAARRTDSAARLRESEARFRSLTDLSSDWYWEQDREYRFTRLEGRQVRGGEPRAREDVLGTRCWDGNLEVEGGWPAYRARLEARERFHDLLMWRRTAAGDLRYVRISGEPVFDAAGRFAGYRGVGSDVTLQKRGEALLRLQHAITRALAEAVEPVAGVEGALRAVCENEGWDCGELWRAEAPGAPMRRFASWSVPGVDPARRFLELSGSHQFGPDHGLIGAVSQSGKPLWIADATQDPRAVRKFLSAETGLLAALLCPMYADGHVAGVLTFACCRIRPPDDALLEALAAVATQLQLFLRRMDSEARLRESEARFRRTFELAGSGLAHVSQERRFLRVNHKLCEILGYGEDELIGRAVSEVSHPDDVSAVDAGRGRLFRGEIDSLRLEKRFLRKDGSPVWTALTLALERDERGAPLYVIAVFDDITARKRDEQLLRLEHTVALLFTESADAPAALRAALRAICESERWEYGRYLHVDEAAGVLRAGEAWSVPDPALERYVESSRGMQYRRGAGLVGLVWETGEPVWVPDIGVDPRVARKTLAQETGMRGAFAVPVAMQGRVIGVFIFHSRELRQPDLRLLQAMQLIGSQVGQFMQRAHTEEALRESETRFRALTEMSSDFYWETDAAHRLVDMTYGRGALGRLDGALDRAAWDLPSTHPDEAGWARLRAKVDAREPFRDFEFGRPRRDGGVRYFSVSGEPRLAPDGAFMGYRGVGREITEVVLARERIASLAYQDALTGLANRASLAPALEQAVERTRRRGSKLAGVFLDLDGFKRINDLHGHDAGDRLLVEAARRLRAELRAGDPVARLGGDEFFVVLEDLQGPGPAERVARTLLEALRQPFDLGEGREARISVSIGISLFPDDAADAATLVKHADQAMYAAKQAGKNAYRFFSGPA